MLSLYGNPSCGKSSLAVLLNRCFFMDWEGIPMVQYNTGKGEIRNIAQISSLVVPLLESRSAKQKFEMGNILPFYNRNPLQVKAKTSNNMENIRLKLQAALAFIQNNEQFATKEEKERIISLHFQTQNKTTETFKAFQKLQKYTKNKLAFVGDTLLKNREYFESRLIENIETFNILLESEKEEEEAIKDTRSREHHAILLGSLASFDAVCKWTSKELSALILDKTREVAKKKETTATTDHHLADVFLDNVYERCAPFENGAMFKLDKASGKEIIVLHMATVFNYLNVPIGKAQEELLNALKKHTDFIEIKPVRMGIKLKKAWCFKKRPIDTEMKKV
jgi:hypothetical protein